MKKKPVENKCIRTPAVLKFLVIIVLLPLLYATQSTAKYAENKQKDLVNKARKLHFSIPTIDTHCDIPMKMDWYDVGEKHDFGYLDLPRMKEGGLTASFFAVYVPQGSLDDISRKKAFDTAKKTLDLINDMYVKHKSICEPGLSPDDILRTFKTGKRCILIGLENAYPLGLEISNIDRFYERGVRYITLSHTTDNDVCDSSTDKEHPEDNGLSSFGEKVIERMNELGIIVDVSHISEQSFFDVIERSAAPVIASHSCIMGVKEHPQNLTDKQLLALKKNGGVIHINFVRPHLRNEVYVPENEREMNQIMDWVNSKGGVQSLSSEDRARFTRETRAVKRKYPAAYGSVKDVVDHIDYVRSLIGIDHVGIGSDFEGGGYLSNCYTVVEMPNITEELLRRGYNESEIRKIWAGNFIQVFKEVESIAAKWQESI